MKRLGLIVVVLFVAVVVWRPATGQDNYEERIEDLETRVAVLEGEPIEADEEPVGGKTADGYTLVGTYEVIGDSSNLYVNYVGGDRGPDDTCMGLNDFANFGYGSVVTVADGGDDAIGEGEITRSLATKTGVGERRCEMQFVVEGLPKATKYVITVAPFGPAEVTFAQLERLDWNLSLTVGE